MKSLHLVSEPSYKMALRKYQHFRTPAIVEVKQLLGGLEGSSSSQVGEAKLKHRREDGLPSAVLNDTSGPLSTTR